MYNGNGLCVQKQREDIIWKNQQEIGKAVAKEQALNNLRLEQEQRRIQLSEMRRQAHKAEYMDLELTQSGELLMKVQSPLINIPDRKVANFRLIDAVELRSTGGEKDMFCIFVEINERKADILLDKKKIGHTGYFLKKIVQSGGLIYIEKRSRKEELLDLFWQKILELASRAKDNYIEICMNRGWNVNQDGELRFAKEGEILWEEIKKAAK